MITIVTNPEPTQPLLDLLVELLDSGTLAHEAADPWLPAGLALVVTPTDRVLISTAVDLDQDQAVELLEQARRTTATLLTLPRRSDRLSAALRDTLNQPAPGLRAS